MKGYVLSSPGRVGVLVSGGGTNLQALIDAEAAGKLGGGKLACVISSRPGVYALERASKAGIPAIPLCHSDFSREGFDLQLLHHLKSHQVDIVVLAGFLCILGDAFIAAYPGRILNVHPSLIPSFCGEGYYGLRVHRAALDRGVKITGATVHLVNGMVDGGPILLQKAVEVLDGDTPETLQQRVMEQAEWELLPKAVAMLCDPLRGIHYPPPITSEHKP